jgi:hypothetical protein
VFTLAEASKQLHLPWERGFTFSQTKRFFEPFLAFVCNHNSPVQQPYNRPMIAVVPFPGQPTTAPVTAHQQHLPSNGKSWVWAGMTQGLFCRWAATLLQPQ